MESEIDKLAEALESIDKNNNKHNLSYIVLAMDTSSKGAITAIKGKNHELMALLMNAMQKNPSVQELLKDSVKLFPGILKKIENKKQLN